MTSAATALPGEAWLGPRPGHRPAAQRARQRGHQRGHAATARQARLRADDDGEHRPRGGVSRATIYRRYRDKADVVTDAIAGAAAVQPASDRPADPSVTSSASSKPSTAALLSHASR